MGSRLSIRFTGQRQLELHEDAIPVPGPGQLLARSRRTLISAGTELTCFARRFAAGTHWDAWIRYPFRPGYLNAGVVEAVGAGVQGWAPGDRIAFRAGHTSHDLVDTGATMQARAARIPDGLDDDAACWMGLGKIVQVGVRAARHELGDVVAVVGLGQLGQLAVQYARLMGAARIIAIDPLPRRVDLAIAHGATDGMCARAADVHERVRGIAASHGVDGADIVYEITGDHATLAQALPLVRSHGRLVLLGDAGDPARQTLTPDVINRGVRIIGAHDSHPPEVPTAHVRWSDRQMDAAFLAWLARGDLRMNGLVSHHFHPRQAAEAYDLLDRRRDEAMGVIFDWG